MLHCLYNLHETNCSRADVLHNNKELHNENDMTSSPDTKTLAPLNKNQFKKGKLYFPTFPLLKVVVKK